MHNLPPVIIRQASWLSTRTWGMNESLNWKAELFLCHVRTPSHVASKQFWSGGLSKPIQSWFGAPAEKDRLMAYIISSPHNRVDTRNKEWILEPQWLPEKPFMVTSASYWLWSRHVAGYDVELHDWQVATISVPLTERSETTYRVLFPSKTSWPLAKGGHAINTG